MSLEAWKSFFDIGALVLLFLTFAFGAGILITGNIINKRQGEQLRQFDKGLTDAKTELGKQQERAAKAEERVALAEQHSAEANSKAEGFRLDIAKANESAAQAQARVAGATAEAAKAILAAADANKATEDERMARVKIKEGIAWRRMGQETRASFGAKFFPFAGQRSGIGYNANDVEASGFATDLALALHDVAKWSISEPQPVMKMREGPVPVGTNPPLERGVFIVTTADVESRRRAGLLAKELNGLGFDSVVSGNIDRRSTIPTVYIWVEPRPEGPQGEAKVRAQKENKQ